MDIDRGFGIDDIHGYAVICFAPRKRIDTSAFLCYNDPTKGGGSVFKYRFPCLCEEETRALFENRMLNDAPCGKGLFGTDLWRQGLHFTECGERIKGFYLPEHECNSTRGSPIRTTFFGKFVKDGDNTFFEVYIYPRVIEIIFIIFGYLLISISAEFIVFLFTTLVFGALAFGHWLNIKETVEDFKKLIL